MGTMPFHLEKGVLGLRLDYLTRSPAVRNHVVLRLLAGEDPFVVAATINVLTVGNIDVFTDKKADFVQKLDDLLVKDPTPHDPHGKRSGQEYWEDQRDNLRPANNDNTGNRNAFNGFWGPRQHLVRDTMRRAMIRALTSGKRIDFWWECSLPDGSDPSVMVAETPGAAHVLFLTDHGPVEDPKTGVRGTPDPDPQFPPNGGGGHHL